MTGGDCYLSNPVSFLSNERAICCMQVTYRSPHSKPLPINRQLAAATAGRCALKKITPSPLSALWEKTSVPGSSSKDNRRQAAAGPTNLPSVTHHWAPVDTEQRTAHYQPLLAVAVHLGSPHDRNSLQSHPAAAQPSPRCTRHRGVHTSSRRCVGSVTASRDLPLSGSCLDSPRTSTVIDPTTQHGRFAGGTT